MQRHRTPSLVVSSALLIPLLVAACAGSPARLDTVGSPVDGSAGGGDPRPAPTAAPAPGSGQVTNGSTVAVRDDAKIVRTGTLQLRVTDLPAAVREASAAIDRVGGYVGASQVANDGDRSVATITYRIPTDRWDEALEALRGVANEVLGEQTEAVEVTGQLVDLEARIANLRASERALQGIAEQATRIDDILDVQARLTDVRGQIEQLSAQQAQLTDRVAYGTLRVTFGLEVVAVTEAAAKWDAATEVDRATATLLDILQAVAAAGIWVGIVWLPVLAGLGVVGLVAWFVLRRTGLIRTTRYAEPPATHG